MRGAGYGTPSKKEAMTEDSLLRAYVGLGSNCRFAEKMLARARKALGALPGVRFGAASPVYRTEPQGKSDQPWFLNQVVQIFPDESWTPCLLVGALLGMEAALGRRRSLNPALRFGPRTIDADLLLFGQEQSRAPQCIVPHPRLTVRAFVLVPLLDLAPDIVIDGRSARHWLSLLRWHREGERIFQ